MAFLVTVIIVVTIKLDSWRKLNQVGCSCTSPNVTFSGAMWLGNLHDRRLVQRYISLAQQWQWQKIVDLLTIMAGEIDLPPYFYTLKEIAKFSQLDLPKRSHLIQALQQQGYQAALTHINPQAIKTNASMDSIINQV